MNPTTDNPAELSELADQLIDAVALIKNREPIGRELASYCLALMEEFAASLARVIEIEEALAQLEREGLIVSVPIDDLEIPQ